MDWPGYFTRTSPRGRESALWLTAQLTNRCLRCLQAPVGKMDSRLRAPFKGKWCVCAILMPSILFKSTLWELLFCKKHNSVLKFMKKPYSCKYLSLFMSLVHLYFIYFRLPKYFRLFFKMWFPPISIYIHIYKISYESLNAFGYFWKAMLGIFSQLSILALFLSCLSTSESCGRWSWSLPSDSLQPIYNHQLTLHGRKPKCLERTCKLHTERIRFDFCEDRERITFLC